MSQRLHVLNIAENILLKLVMEIEASDKPLHSIKPYYGAKSQRKLKKSFGNLQ